MDEGQLAVLVAEFAADWPFSHPRPTPETNRHYRQMVRRFVEKFGDRALVSLGTAELQVWAMENLSALRFVRSLLQDAVLDGHLTVNPAGKVKVPRAPRRRKEEEVPTPAQVHELLEAAWARNDLQMQAVIALGAYVGLRQSEILGLGYGSMDAECTRLHVHQQLSRDGETLKPIKGKVLAREVDVFSVARPYVLGWANDPDASETFIVGPLDHGELRKRWDVLRGDTGLRCEFHQLRSACASWLLDAGASPIDVAIMLHGHSDPTTVLTYYAFVDRSKALSRLSKIVDGDAS